MDEHLSLYNVLHKLINYCTYIEQTITQKLWALKSNLNRLLWSELKSTWQFHKFVQNKKFQTSETWSISSWSSWRRARSTWASPRSSCRAARSWPAWSRWTWTSASGPPSDAPPAASFPRTGWRWPPGTGWSWRTNRSENWSLNLLLLAVTTKYCVLYI